VFTSTGGPFTVTLNATAGSNPTSAGTKTLTPSGNSGATMCDFDVTVNPAPANPDILSCKIDGVQKTFNFNTVSLTVPNPPAEMISVNGNACSSCTESCSVAITNTNGSVAPGTYTQANAPGYILQMGYADPAGNPWMGFTPLHNFTITITTLTATRIIGTFSGTIQDGTLTNTKIITNGIFDMAR